MATANGTTLEDAQEYAGDDAPTGVRAEALLRDAARSVRSIAPPPSPVPVDYKADASDAELYLFAYFAKVPGYISSMSADDVSISYREESQDSAGGPYARVRMMMSQWLEGPASEGGVGRNRYSNVLKDNDLW